MSNVYIIILVLTLLCQAPPMTCLLIYLCIDLIMTALSYDLERMHRWTAKNEQQLYWQLAGPNERNEKTGFQSA
jgi:hypothetical protein